MVAAVEVVEVLMEVEGILMKVLQNVLLVGFYFEIGAGRFFALISPSR